MTVDRDGVFRGGRFDGVSLAETPANYLGWLVEEPWVDDELYTAVADELARRFAPLPVCRPSPAVYRAATLLIERGYRMLAKSAHPDAGGQHNDMVLLGEARGWLQRVIREAA